MNTLVLKPLYLALILGGLLLPFISKGSHIVGGEITYNCIGLNNFFEIRLTVYRDCAFGASNAQFDNPAAVGFFDANNNLVTSVGDPLTPGQILMPFTFADTVTTILSDSCLFVPNTVCVQTTTYIDTIQLPPIPGGYQIVYQRCCRNANVNNILNPEITGASFVAYVSEKALLECNNSPAFAELPPVFICVNEPIFLDQSVIDVEGDSLVYQICTPLSGASFNDPQPQPPFPPPYPEVLWNDPPYNLNNPLGGTPLQIDPNTGIMTGIPNTIGQFVVGLCIEEYRNGQLLSTTRRDFQYIVGVCQTVEAGITIPNVQCDDLTVQFHNTSQNADDFLWYFNDPAYPDSTSTLADPVYTYSDTGLYAIMLIAEPQSVCADTTFGFIELKTGTVDPEFEFLIFHCMDSVMLAFNDVTVDSQQVIQSWLWELGDGQSSTEQNPIFVIDSTQSIIVGFGVTEQNGCTTRIQQIIPASVILGDPPSETISICMGDSVLLNDPPYLSPNSVYNWAPAIGLNNSQIPSPLAAPDTTTIYTLIIQDTLNECVAELQTTVEVIENPVINISVATTVCGSFTTLIADANISSGSFLWATDPFFSNIISDSSSVTVNDLGINTYYVQFSTPGGCIVTDSITLIEQALNIDLADTASMCLGDTLIIEAINLDPADSVIYTWSPGIGMIPAINPANLIISPPVSGEFIYYLEAENQFGCTYLDSVIVTVYDESEPPQVSYTLDCNSNVVDFLNSGNQAAYYEWVIEIAPGNEVVLSGAQVSYTFPAAGTYSVVLQPIAGLPCSLLSESFEVTVGDTLVSAGFDWSYINCNDDLILQFEDTSTAVQGIINTWEWLFSNGTISTEQHPVLDIGAAQELIVQLTVTTDEGCVSVVEDTLQVEFTDFGNFDHLVVSCFGDSVVLNEGGNINFDYNWSPANWLSDPAVPSPLALPPMTTGYLVTISDPGNQGCETLETVTVIIPDEFLQADFNYQILDCQMDTAIIEFSDASIYSPGNIISWNWSFSDGQSATDQNPTMEFYNLDSVLVQLVVNTDDGCQHETTQTIPINSFSLALPDEIVKCSGVPVNLNPNADNSLSYLWSPSTDLNDPTAPNPIANPAQTTTYCVTVTNGNCTATDCVEVLVPDIPLTADFSYTASDCIDEAIINFEDESVYSLGNVVEWNWTFGGTVTSNLPNPVLIIDQDTVLDVVLEVMSEDGCTATFIDQIEINLIQINIPNQIVNCDGTGVVLNENGNPNHTYSWSPSNGLSATDIPSPIANPSSTTNYIVIISDGVCQIVESVQVIVPAIPLQVDFSWTVDDCTDEAVIHFEDQSVYAPGNIASWNWQFSNGMVSSLENPTLILDQSQLLEVELTVITNDGCTATLNQEIPVNLIDINVQDSIVNCDGDPVELNPGGNSTYSYLWSPSTGLNDPMAPNPVANPNITTTYEVQVNNGVCQITREVTVVIPSIPVAAGFDFSFDDCTDNAVIEFMDNSISSSPVTNWAWTFSGNITFGSSEENPIITLTESDTILVELTVTTEDGCTSTYTEEIEVNLIDINVPGSIIYCSSEPLILNPNGNPNYTYNWSPAAGLSSSTAPSPEVLNLTQNTVYTLMVTHGNCTLTRVVEILVPDIPLEANFSWSYENCIDSSTIAFTDASQYSGNIIGWEWVVEGDTSYLQNSVFNFYQNQTLDIQLVVTTAHGCLDTLMTTIESVILDVDLPSSVASCNGDGVYLNPNGNPDYSYQWYPNIGLNDDTLAVNPFAAPDSMTVYSVIIMDSISGCMDEQTVLFNVPTIPLTAGFEWEFLSCSDSASIEFLDTTLYSGMVSEWDWILDNGVGDTVQHPTFTFYNMDTINVQLIVTSNDGCVDSVSNMLTVDILNLDFLADTLQKCEGDTLFLNPNGNPDLIYNWSPADSLSGTNIYNPIANPSNSTLYTVTITSPNNTQCHEELSVDVLVADQPLELIWNYPLDTVICDLSLDLVGQSSSAVQYEWAITPDFQDVLSGTPEYTASPQNGTTYYLRVTDSLGCSLMDSTTITSRAILAVLETDTTICVGDTIDWEVLTAASSGVNLDYEWFPQDSTVIGGMTSTPLFHPPDSTTYSLTIQNEFDCIWESDIQVNVVDLAELIEVYADRDTIFLGESVQLYATDLQDLNYSWEPCETLNFCQIADPVAQPEETTIYHLWAENTTYECFYEDSIRIVVNEINTCEAPFIFVPKGFTPNDDGLNDVLYVRGNEIEELFFAVYNRWGEKVFETRDKDLGWDGKVNGQKVNPDVFGYILQVKCLGGGENTLKGNVTLIR